MWSPFSSVHFLRHILPQVVSLLALGMAYVPAQGATVDAAPDFNQSIRPLLSDRCYACHGPDPQHREAGLRLDTREGAYGFLKNSETHKAIVPGDREGSAVWQHLVSRDPDERMPPPDSKLSLSPEEIERIGAWIDGGAVWEDHWSFQRVEKPDLPTGSMAGARNEIDRFLLQQLQKEGLGYAPEASRPALLRRLALDLTGLPPSPEQVQAFVHDTSPQAYEKQVDALLASPHFGEHMALPWLDAARYADTHGYQADWPRDMWPWRDWVIRAFNENMTFDQFTVEQLAGDLLPNPTESQRIATGFNRNHRINDEGGSIAAEFLTEYVIDRVDTTSAVWLGLTMNCCRCHDHKYDPLSMEDFYRFYAYFNRVPEKGKDGRNGACEPTLTILPDSVKEEMAKLESEAEALREEAKKRKQSVEKDFLAWRTSQPHLDEKNRIGEWIPQPSGSLLESLSGTSVPPGKSFQIGEKEGRLGISFQEAGAIALGDLADVEKDVAFSGTAWIHVPKDPQVQTLVARMNEAEAHRGWDLVVKNNHTLVFHLIHAFPKNYIQVATRDPLPTNAWCQVAFTYSGNGSANGVKLYVNGVAVPTTTAADTLTQTIRTQVPLRFGQREKTLPLRNGLLGSVTLARRVLSAGEIQASYRGTPLPETPVPTRYVRVEIPGRKEYLSLAEVEVFHWDRNIAPEGNALQSSVFNNEGEANLAIDGNHNGQYAKGRTITHTEQDWEPWWELDLIEAREVQRLVIWNRTDGDLGHRLDGAVVILQDSERNEIYREALGSAPDRWEIQVAPAFASRLLADPQRDLPPAEEAFLRSYFVGKNSPVARMEKEIAKKETDIRRLKDKGVRTMVMEEMTNPRPTHLLQRGQYDQPDLSRELTPGTPAVLPPPDPNLPDNRLQLARWLVSRDNPLPSRVTVNRFWASVFGQGLVRTVEDFGVQGESPSHPELLDWLAADFMENGWDVKRLMKQLVMSAAYRQDSRVQPDLLERDPENRWLARGPRFRLTAHAIRDQALTASGLLNPRIGGPSVKVYQPPGLWKEVSFQDRNRPSDFYVQDTGDALYRRSLYVYWKRTLGPPMLATFDAARRETCTLKTPRTNTPLQALNLMNDTTFLEAARKLAERMIREGGTLPTDRIRKGHELLLGRAPNPRELEVYLAGFRQYLSQTQSQPELNRGLMSQGDSPAPTDLALPELTAYTLVASVLLNLDEAVTKE